MSSGVYHPPIGYGTYKVGYIPPTSAAVKDGTVKAGELEDASEIIKNALDTNLYPFLDCAEFYNNEKSVGSGIQKSNISRSDLFIASKVWTSTMEEGPAAVRSQVMKTLSDLGTDYIDLYCIHWPVPNKIHVEAYKALQSLQDEGYIKHLGVSNYGIEDYEELRKEGCRKPEVVQIEVNPFCWRPKTVGYFQSEGIVVQSYRSLRDGKEFSNPTLSRIGSKYNKTTAQVLGRWCVQKGVVYMPKSVRVDRMVENAGVFDWEMDGEDMEILDALTNDEGIEKMIKSYKIGVLRDTTLEGKTELVREITRG